jgi:hypothetical protein
VFEIVPAVAGAVTVMEIAGAVPRASADRVQVTMPEAWPQVHPVPLAPTNATVPGSVSVTVSPAAGSGPLLVTVSVYVSVPPAVTGSGLSVLTRDSPRRPRRSSSRCRVVEGVRIGGRGAHRGGVAQRGRAARGLDGDGDGGGRADC